MNCRPFLAWTTVMTAHVSARAFSVLLALALPSAARAQGWVRSFSFLDYSEFSAVLALHDGGIAAAGTFRGEHWDRTFIVRIDKDGRVIWIRSIGSGTYFEPTFILEASGGEIVLGGGSYVTWFDASGNLVRQRRYLVGSDVWDTAGSSTNDQGIILARAVRGDDGGGVRVLRLDDEGAVRWKWDYTGAIGDVLTTSVVEVPGGGFCVFAGLAEGLVLLRLDSNGKLGWQRQFNTPGDYYLWGAVANTPDGGFIVGTSRWWYGDYRAWIFKLDREGNLEWQREAGLGNYVYPTALRVLPNGNVILAGSSYTADTEALWLAQFAPDGSLMTQRVIKWPFTARARAMDSSSDGAVILAGEIREYPKNGALLLRIPENGNMGEGCWPDLQTRHGWSEEGAYEEAVSALKRLPIAVTVTAPELKITIPSPIVGNACAKPDLVARWLQIGVTDQVLTASLSVMNIGGEQSRGCKTWIYFSKDAALSPADELISVRRISWLESGGDFTIATTYERPDDPRGLFVIAVIDALNAVAEGDEANNFVIGQVPLQSVAD